MSKAESAPALAQKRIIGIGNCYHRNSSEIRIEPELDSEHVQLILVSPDARLDNIINSDSLVIRKDDAQRLNLMVGDIVTIKIIKPS